MKFLRFLLILILTTGAAKASAPDVTIPFQYYQRLIFIRMSVNETDSLLFLFDTGTNTSALDMEAAETLRLHSNQTDSLEGTAGIIAVEMAKLHSLFADRARVNDLEVTLEDLGSSLAPPGKRLNGILGTDFMKHFAITIDFRKHNLVFSSEPDYTGDTIPFEMDNNIPAIHATILDTLKIRLRYDSGSSLFESDSTYINVTEDTWTALQANDSTLKPVGYFLGSGTGGTVKLPVIQVQLVALNEKPVQYPFLLVQPKQGYFARPDAIGFFGNNLMEKYGKVVVDFLGSKICLVGTE